MFVTPYTRRRNDLDIYNPFHAMEEWERSFLGTSNAFKTDIREEEKEFVLEADLPGFKKEDIHIDLENDKLTISAERHSDFEQKDKKGNYLRQERSYGSFTRSFDTTGIDTAAMKAGFENGVLTLHMPKLQETLPSARRLEIE